MFYFLYGDTPLPLKYEELINKIKKENKDIPMKIYDASQKEEESFLEAISTNSMFSPKELIILKRSENLKKIEDFFKIVLEYNLLQKEVVVVYEEELNDYGKAKNEVSSKILKLVEKIGKSISARKSEERKGLHFYAEKELGISEYEAEKLVEILGDDFFKVKNEIEKIKNYLGNEKFILENVLPILTVSKEYSLKILVDNLILKNEKIELLEYLKKTKEGMLFLNILTDELMSYLKVILLKEQGIIGSNINYNFFKTNIYPEIKKYFKKRGSYVKEYPIFLRLNIIDKFTKKSLQNQLTKILETEYNIKSGKIEEEIGIEKLILGLKK